MCGGFTCSKNSLIALNVLYIVVSITLISVAAYAKFAYIVSSISLVSGIIACGVFLLFLSIVGIVASNKHHQVLLFFYMIILFLIFIIQFSVACACLAMNKNQQNTLAKQGWNFADDDLKEEAQFHFHCCGYDGINETRHCERVTNGEGTLCCPVTQPTCCTAFETESLNSTCKCSPCNDALQKAIGGGLSTVGGIGLFFSFTEVIGFFVAKRYRHQIDPMVNVQSLLQQ